MCNFMNNAKTYVQLRSLVSPYRCRIALKHLNFASIVNKSIGQINK